MCVILWCASCDASIGTGTYLSTDVEGSTRLRELFPTMSQAEFDKATFLGPASAFPRRILWLESVTAIVILIATTTWCSILPSWTVQSRPGVAAIPLEPAPPPIAWSLVQRDIKNEAQRSDAADQLVKTCSVDSPRSGVEGPLGIGPYRAPDHRADDAPAECSG